MAGLGRHGNPAGGKLENKPQSSAFRFRARSSAQTAALWLVVAAALAAACGKEFRVAEDGGAELGTGGANGADVGVSGAAGSAAGAEEHRTQSGAGGQRSPASSGDEAPLTTSGGPGAGGARGDGTSANSGASRGGTGNGAGGNVGSAAGAESASAGGGDSMESTSGAGAASSTGGTGATGAGATGTDGTTGTGGTGNTGGTGGTGNTVVTQELVDEGDVDIWDFNGTVSAWGWWYHDNEFVSFESSLGMLTSVTIEQSLEIEFEIPPGTLGDSFQHRLALFKDDGAVYLVYEADSFEVSAATMSRTYTYTYSSDALWSEPGWRYYFEVQALESPFHFRNVTRFTYHFTPLE